MPRRSVEAEWRPSGMVGHEQLWVDGQVLASIMLTGGWWHLGWCQPHGWVGQNLRRRRAPAARRLAAKRALKGVQWLDRPGSPRARAILRMLEAL